MVFLTVFGDVVELQVEEDFVASFLELGDDPGSGGIKQLHADLDKGFFLLKLVQESQRLFPAGEIRGNDDVLSHGVRLL